jgi:hypothetical protein
MPWDALGCLGMPWDALGCLGMPWDALGCLGMSACKCTLICGLYCQPIKKRKIDTGYKQSSESYEHNTGKMFPSSQNIFAEVESYGSIAAVNAINKLYDALTHVLKDKISPEVFQNVFDCKNSIAEQYAIKEGKTVGDGKNSSKNGLKKTTSSEYQKYKNAMIASAWYKEMTSTPEHQALSGAQKFTSNNAIINKRWKEFKLSRDSGSGSGSGKIDVSEDDDGKGEGEGDGEGEGEEDRDGNAGIIKAVDATVAAEGSVKRTTKAKADTNEKQKEKAAVKGKMKPKNVGKITSNDGDMLEKEQPM